MVNKIPYPKTGSTEREEGTLLEGMTEMKRDGAVEEVVAAVVMVGMDLW